MKPTTFEMRVLDKTNRHLSCNEDAKEDLFKDGKGLSKEKLSVHVLHARPFTKQVPALKDPNAAKDDKNNAEDTTDVVSDTSDICDFIADMDG